MTIDYETLDQFRPDVSPPVAEEEFTEGLKRVLNGGLGFTTGLLLAFDQSLANTGYIAIDYDHLTGITIIEMDTIHTKTRDAKKSWDDTLDRASRLFSDVAVLVDRLRPKVILHETPPVGTGPNMRRTESSVVTATVIHAAAVLNEIPVAMVSAQKVKYYLTGNRVAKKQEVRKALEKRFQAELDSPGLRKNEHTFDAFGIAVTFMEQG